MSCSSTIWPGVSAAAGSVSFITSFIAQIPQLIETYKDKTVEGLSPIFLLAWLFGDITSLIGALLTHQLPFQIILALYFMANDMFICGQYYYYGILHQNKLATPGHESKISAERIATISSRGSLDRGLKKKSWLASLFVFGNSAHGFPILMSYMTKASGDNTLPPPAPVPSSSGIGIALSWVGAMCYVCARIPQLIKNYKRKSTDGLSPFLFINTLLTNITYALSIFTSCDYLDCEDKKSFVLNELPFLVGSVGTVFFDLTYFYQHYILYADDVKLRELEAQEADETTPLL